MSERSNDGFLLKEDHPRSIIILIVVTNNKEEEEEEENKKEEVQQRTMDRTKTKSILLLIVVIPVPKSKSSFENDHGMKSFGRKILRVAHHTMLCLLLAAHTVKNLISKNTYTKDH